MNSLKVLEDRLKNMVASIHPYLANGWRMDGSVPASGLIAQISYRKKASVRRLTRIFFALVSVIICAYLVICATSIQPMPLHHIGFVTVISLIALVFYKRYLSELLRLKEDYEGLVVSFETDCKILYLDQYFHPKPQFLHGEYARSALREILLSELSYMAKSVLLAEDSFTRCLMGGIGQIDRITKACQHVYEAREKLHQGVLATQRFGFSIARSEVFARAKILL